MIATRLCALLTVAVATLPAFAQDAREMTTPTPWRYYYAASAATVTGAINSGYRITDIEVESASPIRFNVAMVRNTGAYQSGFWWYYGLTGAGLANHLSANTGRLISLAPYEVNGATRFACVMVPNTGSQAKAWWYYFGAQPATIQGHVNTNNARLVDFDSYEIGGSTYYSAVMIRNTGSDQRPWWWYYNATAATINSNIQTNSSRVYDIERRPNGRFNVILVRDPQPVHWSWWYGLSASTLEDTYKQWGHRIIDIETYFVNGSRRFAVAMINNENALTTRVGDILRQGTNGTTGLYLKEVNGPVLADLNESTQFEPASAIKVLHHTHAMRQVRLGNTTMNTQLTVFTGMNGSCPTNANPIQEPLTTVLRLMMENSDNARTQAVAATFGQGAINATAAALGMSSTSLNHLIGCGGAAIANPNRLTLVDLGRLHEQVANGYLGNFRNVFYEHMLNSLSWAGINGIIDQEAANIGLSATTIATFKAQVELARKGGSYTLSSSGVTREYRAGFGWIKIPFQTGCAPTPREFVVGAFADAASNGQNASTAVNTAVGELLRGQLRDALASWNCVVGSVVPVGQGCGSGRLVHTQTASGVPEIGRFVTYESRYGEPGAFVVMTIGFSNQIHNGVMLPYELAPQGFPGCFVYNDIFGTETRVADPSGFAAVRLGIPNHRSWVGAEYYTQFFSLGTTLTTSNGMKSTVGGPL